MKRFEKFLADHDQHEITIKVLSKDDRDRYQATISIHISFHDGKDWMGRDFYGNHLEQLVDRALEVYEREGVER